MISDETRQKLERLADNIYIVVSEAITHEAGCNIAAGIIHDFVKDNIALLASGEVQVTKTDENQDK